MIQNQIFGLLDSAFSKCGSSNNTERQAGENELKTIKTQVGYSIALLKYIEAAPTQEKGLRASIELKLWMQFYKQLELFEIEQYQSIIEQMKSRIIDIYLISPPHISDQISEAILNMTAMEFPDRWQNLMKTLVIKVTENSANTLRVVALMTMITYRYTYSSRSDPLYSEIILVCDDTHDFLLRVTESALECIQNNHHETQNLQIVLRTAMRLFYNLNYQDLHPLFEDNLRKWMTILVRIMRLAGQNLSLLKVKSQTLKCILLYASKYKEDIQPIIKDFSEEIWKLCSNTKGDDEISQKIQLIALKYFKHLIVWQDMKKFFSEHLETLLQTLIFPSIGFNKTNIALFQDEPTLFIENYFENSEINTRRSSAIDLLKNITKSYNFGELIIKQLISYQQIANIQGRNPYSECLILNLVIDSGTVAFRSVDGVTQISISQEIITHVYLKIVKPMFSSVYEWILANSDKKIEAHFSLIHLTIHLRFVFYFRLYLPKEDLRNIVKFCCSLNTNSETFRCILCMLLQALIDIKFGDYTYYSNLIPYFDEQKLDTLAFDVLKMIFTIENQQKQLNKYLTKTLFVLCYRLKQKSVKYSEHFMAVISNMLKKTDIYDFKCVVFLFEAFSTLTYYMVAQNANIHALQTLLNAYFAKVLQQGSDLLNFTFQIYSLIILMKNNAAQSYTTLYLSVLSATNWSVTNSSLFTAYIQYITSYLKNHSGRTISDKPHIQLILVKLIEMKDYRHFSSFLNGILEILGLDGFYSSGYLAILLEGTTAALNELQPKTSVLKQAILLFCSIIVNYQPKKVIQYVDQFVIQSNQISPRFIQNLMIQGLSIISMIQLRDERRWVFQGISTLIGLNLLSSIEKWAVMLNALIQNTNRRYIGRTTSLGENLESDSAYQKLSVFKLLQSKPSQLTNDEERFFVEKFRASYGEIQGKVSIAQLIPEKSQQQLTRLINKYQQQA